MKLDLFKDAAGEWRWSAVAGNGEIVADSAEGYVNRAGCLAEAFKLFPDAELRIEDGGAE